MFGRPQPEFCVFRLPGSVALVPDTAHWFCHVCTSRRFLSPSEFGAVPEAPLTAPHPPDSISSAPPLRDGFVSEERRLWLSLFRPQARGRPIWFPVPGDLRVSRHGRVERHVSYLFSLAAVAILVGQQPPQFGFQFDSESWRTFVNAVAERHAEEQIEWDVPGHVDDAWQDRAIEVLF